VLESADGRPVDRRTLDRRSPLRTVDARCAPVLIAHGARDPRIPVADVVAFVERARSLGVTVRFLPFDDEGHAIHSGANRTRLYQQIAAFLEVYLADR
jgi:dipeptidyl aminopeptidase/acylaminoacyl peptidase